MPTKALPAFLALLLLFARLSHAQTQVQTHIQPHTHMLPGIVAAFSAPPPAPTTWYVRPDGGPRDSPGRRATGLPSICDGQADAAPVGTAQGSTARSTTIDSSGTTRPTTMTPGSSPAAIPSSFAAAHGAWDGMQPHVQWTATATPSSRAAAQATPGHTAEPPCRTP